jgi:hypothetical protein
MFALILVGAAAAVTLVVVGVNLLTDINGPECHREFPACTTPTQQSVRQTFAMFCAVGVLAYLVAAPPAVKALRFNWSHTSSALSSPSPSWLWSPIPSRICGPKRVATSGSWPVGRCDRRPPSRCARFRCPAENFARIKERVSFSSIASRLLSSR